MDNVVFFLPKQIDEKICPICCEENNKLKPLNCKIQKVYCYSCSYKIERFDNIICGICKI